MKKKYGSRPVLVGNWEVPVQEMMYYQYLPIKVKGGRPFLIEERLKIFEPMLTQIVTDFEDTFGLERLIESYVYITVKHLFQTSECSFNREGWHADGFMTDDINYIWSDKIPTVFNLSEFNLTLDDKISMLEMNEQADKRNDYCYPNGTLLRLDQYNIHRVGDMRRFQGMRCFVKVSFSSDKYDLIGNSHNHLFTYNWQMKERQVERNIPQSNKIPPVKTNHHS